MKTVEIPNLGLLMLSQVSFVGAIKVSKTDKSSARYEVVMNSGECLLVEEGNFPREKLVAALRDDYVPAAERDETGGVKIAGSQIGGVR